MIVFLYFLLSITIFPAAMAQPCAGEAAKAGSRNWIVAVGISHYDYQPQLEGPEREVSALVAKLAIRGCVPLNQTYIVTGQAADHGTILLAFSDATARMKPDDTLIFIFAGHGAEVDGEILLLPRETFLDPRSIQSLRSTAISVTQLKQILREKQVSDAVFLLDSCRTFPPLSTATRITVITSSQPGQPSFEVNDSGLMIPAITRMIDEQPRLSVQDVFNSARIEVERKAAWAGKQQYPAMITDAPPGKEKNAALIRRKAVGKTNTSSLQSRALGFAEDRDTLEVLTLTPLPRPPVLNKVN